MIAYGVQLFGVLDAQSKADLVAYLDGTAQLQNKKPLHGGKVGEDM